MASVSVDQLLPSARALHKEFQKLHASIQGHVGRARGAKITSAGCAVVGVVAMCASGPVGIGLGIASAVIGGGAMIGDLVHNHFFTKGPFKDAVDKFEVLALRVQEAQRAEEFDCPRAAQARNVHLASSALSGVANGVSGSSTGVQVATKVAENGDAAEKVVRYGSGVSRYVCRGGTGSGIGSNIQTLKTAEDAASIGSGTVGSGTVVVSRLALGFAIVGAVASCYTAVQACKYPAQNAPLHDSVENAKNEVSRLITELETWQQEVLEHRQDKVLLSAKQMEHGRDKAALEAAYSKVGEKADEVASLEARLAALTAKQRSK